MPDFKRLPSYNTENLIQPLMRALDAVVDPALDDVDEIIVDHDGEVLRSPISVLKASLADAYVDLVSDQSVGGVKTWENNALFEANVGIGTLTPDFALDIEGSSGRFYINPNAAFGSYMVLSALASQEASFTLANATKQWAFWMKPSTDGNLYFYNGAERLTLTEAGKLIVGVGAAGGQLTVHDSADASVGSLNASLAATYSSASPNGLVLMNSRFTGQGSDWNTARIKWGFTAAYTSSGARLGFDVLNAAGNWAQVLLISGDEKVSIGRSTPSPYGRLGIEGGIHFRSSYIMDRATGDATNGYYYQSVRESGDGSNFGNVLGNGAADMATVALTGLIIGTYSNNGTTYANAAIAHAVGQGVNGNLLGSGTHILQEFFLNDGTRRYFNPGGRPANYRAYIRIIVRDSSGLVGGTSANVDVAGSVTILTDVSNSVRVGIDASGFCYVERATGTRSWVIFGEVMYY